MKKSGSKEKVTDSGLPAAEEVLAAAALFASFSRDELATIAERSEFIGLDGGEALFRAGDPGDRLFVVASGSVVISSPSGGAALAEYVAGDSFGEMDLLTRSVRNADAAAGEKCVVLAFPSGGQPLEKALSSRPEVAARILTSFLLVVAGRTRKANALVKENSPWVRELKRQVYGDKLTGLLNKAWLEENLPRLAARPLALVMMKPDNFKEINDRFGHEAGDASLVLMAKELARIADEANRASGSGRATAVRYMGNELAMVYEGMARKEAAAAAKLIQARFGAIDLSPLTKDASLRLSLSLGIVLSPEHGTEASSLIKLSAGLPLEGRARGGSLILFPEDIAGSGASDGAGEGRK